MYEDAKPLCRRALEITEVTLGNDHPDFSDMLKNLVMLLEKQVRATVCGCTPRCFTIGMMESRTWRKIW